MVAVTLLIALILDSGTVYLKSFFRVSLFLPYAVPAVIATLIWGYLYGPAFGPFTQLANALHLPAPDFLAASTVLPSIATIANLGIYRLPDDHLLRRASGNFQPISRGGRDGWRERLHLCAEESSCRSSRRWWW